MSGYVLSVDCGTQSLRCIVFDPKGNMLCKAVNKFEAYYAKKPGYAEQNPRVYYDAMCQGISSLNDQYKEVMDKVDSVSVTAQRDTCICVDEEGNVLRDLISWADERLTNVPRHFSPKNKLALKAVGMYKTALLLSKQCHGHWIEDNEPDIWDKTYKYLQLSGYFNYQLTNKFVDGVASQIGHIPFDYKKRRWEKPTSMKGQIFQLGMDRMPELVESGQVIGYVTKKASEETGLKEGINVIAAGSDKGCETLGVGCDDNHTVSISLGSQASVQASADRYYEVVNFIPPFPGVNPAKYNPEVTVYRGYWMISWFKKEFAQHEVKKADELGVLPEELLNKELQHINPGSDGLILQPYWGVGLKTPEARGSILGFSDYHTRAHIYRAIIEGIGFALLEGIHAMEKKSGHKIKKIMISGGGSNSDEICQITADLMNRPVYRVQTYETSSLGASIVGYIGNGTYDSFQEAKEAMVHIDRAFTPSYEAAEIYKELYHKVYKKVYGKLKPFYKNIHGILKDK